MHNGKNTAITFDQREIARVAHTRHSVQVILTFFRIRNSHA
jgi:hypothetical protein